MTRMLPSLARCAPDNTSKRSREGSMEEPDETQQSREEEVDNPDETPVDHGDGFSVTVAIPKSWEEPDYTSGHSVAWSDTPSIRSDVGWPQIPVVRYVRVPNYFSLYEGDGPTTSLDEIVETVARDAISRIDIYVGMYDVAKETLRLTESSLGSARTKRVQEGPFNLEAIVYTRHAFARSHAKNPLVGPEPGMEGAIWSEYLHSNIYRVWVQLDGVIDALENGRWHSTGKYTNMQRVVADIVWDLDKRPTSFHYGAQEY